MLSLFSCVQSIERFCEVSCCAVCTDYNLRSLCDCACAVIEVVANEEVFATRNIGIGNHIFLCASCEFLYVQFGVCSVNDRRVTAISKDVVLTK